MKEFIVYHEAYDDEGVAVEASDPEDAVEILARQYYYSDPGDPDRFNEVFKCQGKTYTVSAWVDINFRVTNDGEE